MEYTIEQLKNLRLHNLRDYARDIGVKSPTSFRKNDFLIEILAIQSGAKAPHIRSKKGRPAKENVQIKIVENKIETEEIEKRVKKEIIDTILKEIEKKLYKIL